MTGDRPQVVVVGTGSIGRRHLGNLLAMGQRPLVCSEHRRLPSIEVDGHTLPTVSSYQAALDGPADIVLLANPSAFHAAAATQAVEAGKHVLVEKPVALDRADLEPLVRASRRHPDRVVGVVQQLRFHPLLPRLRSALAGDLVGEAVVVEARQGEHIADYHPDEDHRVGYAARAELGGGVLRTQNHLLDLCVHLLGAPQVTSALLRDPGRLGLDVEDAASFLAVAGGVDLYGRVDFLARPRRFSIEVQGEGGRVLWDYYRSVIQVAGPDGALLAEEAVPFDRDSLFRAVLDDFLTAVEDGRPPRCGLAEAAGTVAFIDAIRRVGRRPPLDGTPVEP